MKLGAGAAKVTFGEGAGAEEECVYMPEKAAEPVAALACLGLKQARGGAAKGRADVAMLQLTRATAAAARPFAARRPVPVVFAVA